MNDKLKDAYTAGFFDGEGTVQIRSVMDRRSYRTRKIYKTYQFSVAITQVRGAPLEKLKEWYGGTIKAIHTPRGRPAWVWTARSEVAQKFLLRIKPYVILKKEEIKIALKFRKTMNPQAAKNRLGQVKPLSNKVIKLRDFLINKLITSRKLPNLETMKKEDLCHTIAKNHQVKV